MSYNAGKKPPNVADRGGAGYLVDCRQQNLQYRQWWSLSAAVCHTSRLQGAAEEVGVQGVGDMWKNL